MKDATAEVLLELSNRGYRITRARKELVKKLAMQPQPVSVQDLCGLLPSVDEASVYRTIHTLLQEGFLEEITTHGESSRYALSHGHHHHVVCTGCGWMEHVSCEAARLRTAVPRSFKTVETHEVTLYGLCKKCA